MTRYTGPVVDAHHHFWQPELGHQPWLLPDAHIPFRYGNYESIKRSYLPPDLLRDAKNFKVVGAVTMETEWDEDDPVGEMEYMQQMQDKYGLPNACVAHALLDDDNVEKTIEQLAAMPIVRSVRQKPGQTAKPNDAAAHPSKLMDPRWRKGFELLERYGLTFDLQVAWWHMAEAVDLAKVNPHQLIIVNHAALPADRSAEAMAGWTNAVKLLAAMPNIVMKISGIGLPDTPWTVENNRVVVETLFECFGSDRVMFASNFPVDSVCGSYDDIFGGFVEISKDWSGNEQTDAFIRTAVRCYRLDDSLLQADHAPLQAYDDQMRAEIDSRIGGIAR